MTIKEKNFREIYLIKDLKEPDLFSLSQKKSVRNYLNTVFQNYFYKEKVRRLELSKGITRSNAGSQL